MITDIQTTLRYIFDKIHQYWKLTLFGTILLIFTNWIGIIIPMEVKSLVDKLNHDRNQSDFWISISYIVGLALVMAVIRTGSRITIFGIGRRVESSEKQHFFEHLLKLDLIYFNTQRIGDLISRATSDIQAIRQMMGFGLLNIINIVWIYSFTLPLMFSLNSALTIYVLLGYAPVLWFVKSLSDKLKTLQHKNQEELGNLSSFIQEDLSGIQVIQAYSQSKREIKRFTEINEDYRSISADLARWRSLIWPAMSLARGISLVILVAFATSGKLSPGTITAFVICLERLVFPTAIMGWLITIFQRGSISVARVYEIYNEKPKILSLEQAQLNLPIRHIKVHNLNLGYDGELILKNLSLEIETGQFIGIVGLIGSGKSTFANSLVRVLNTPPGTIFFDQTDITQVSLKELRDQAMLVPQETFLFNASIYENLSLGGDYSRESVIDAARLCQLDQEIEDLPKGYDTVIGEREISLSGGQAQRVALARALIRKPPILLLDDAISSVDNEVGTKILESVRARYIDQTLVLITHRLSSLKAADRIYVFHGGSCIGADTHARLLSSNETYQKLWQIQGMEEAELVKKL
ncbi:MAG: ABC transporter ATP-binding protein [Candidatus Caenarcaniphilales bacterium]|nr:ABC transporter ATP-binding protein [Candidatus Caenarcaniphilales bacterium]